MENLWTGILMASEYTIAERRLHLTNDEYNELRTELMIRTFLRFKNYVLTERYDRNWPIWNGICYAAYGSFRAAWLIVSRHIREKLSTSSIDIPAIDSSSEPISSLIPGGSLPQLNYKNGKPPKGGKLRTPDGFAYEYDLYLEECYDLGIDPVSREDFAVRNGGTKEMANPARTYQEYRNELSRKYRAEARKAADAIKAKLTKSGDRNQPGCRPDSTECLHQ